MPNVTTGPVTAAAASAAANNITATTTTAAPLPPQEHQIPPACWSRIFSTPSLEPNLKPAQVQSKADRFALLGGRLLLL